MMRKINLSNPLETVVKHFNLILEILLDIFAPMKTVKLSPRKREIWFSKDIQFLKRHVRKYERIWRDSPSDTTWDHYRNAYHSAIKKEKRRILSQKITALRGDQKGLYHLMRIWTGTTPQNPLPEGITPQDLAQSFMDFFTKKITNIRTPLLHSSDPYQPRPLKEDIAPLGQFNPVHCDELKKLLGSVQTKSCEIDVIPTSLLKQCWTDMEPVITRIVNLSLESGQFVPQWKEGIIRPLIKKPNVLMKSNYRPVTNLPFLSKFLEKVAMQEVMEHLESHHLLPEHQLAYRQNHSCETALIRITNDILWNMEQHKVTGAISLDLSAVFDTVDHDILLQVLDKRFYVQDVCQKWMDSYLRPCTSQVIIQGKLSRPVHQNQSVPQGSCLGPLLFSAYANTLSKCVPPDTDIHGHADDHFMKRGFSPNIPMDEACFQHSIQSTMECVKNWMNSNRLKLNPDKSEFIYFGSRGLLRNCMHTSVNAAGATVLRSTMVKLLGVILDQHLSYSSHISQKCRIAMLNLCRIRRIRGYLTVDACKSLVQSLVLSHLDYCNALFYGITDSNLRMMQRVQNTAARVILIIGSA